jgi:hypothetical protein
MRLSVSYLRIIKSSNVYFSDQSLHNERKKLGLDLTWNRLKLLYQLQESLHNHSQLPKYWIQVIQRLPEMLKQLPGSSVDSSSATTTVGKHQSSNESASNVTTDAQHAASEVLAKEDDKNVSKTATSPERKVPYSLSLIGEWGAKRFQSDGSNRTNATIPSWRNSTSIMATVSQNIQ